MSVLRQTIETLQADDYMVAKFAIVGALLVISWKLN